MPTITPFLWFDNQAEEAMNFYTSLFPESKIINASYYTDSSQNYSKPNPNLANKLMTATFELCGQQIMVLNGGPYFKLNEAFSLFVSCDTAEEVDFYWDKLIDGGAASQCGWLKDKYGVSWQIIPTLLGKLMGDPDPVKSSAVMKAMMKMVKIDSEIIQKAYEA